MVAPSGRSSEALIVREGATPPEKWKALEA